MKNESTITNILIAILIVLVAILIFVQISDKVDIDLKIKESIKSIEIPKNGKDGYTPIKGIDYTDGINGVNGINGKDGKDSKSTHTIETVIKEVPIKGENGSTPIIRCNADANRWEVKYKDSDFWTLLNEEVVPCTVKGE